MFNSTVTPIVSLLNQLLGPLLAVVGAAGTLYCVLLGVKFAQASEPQDREKAKGALKNAVIGFVLIFVLILGLNLLMPSMIKWVNEQAGGTVIDESSVTGVISGTNTTPNQPVVTPSQRQPSTTPTETPTTPTTPVQPTTPTTPETPTQQETPATQPETPTQQETPTTPPETPTQQETPAPQQETPAPQEETPAPQEETPATQQETPQTRTHTDAERYEIAYKTGGFMRKLIRSKVDEAGGVDKLSDEDAAFIRDTYLTDRTLTSDDVRAIANLICDPDGLANNGLYDNRGF